MTIPRKLFRLAPGELRHRVVIEQPVEVRNEDTGASAISWQTYVTRWARLTPYTGRETDAAGAKQGEVITYALVRYVTGVTPAMRLRYGTQLFDISGILADQSDAEFHTLVLKSGVSDGR